MMGFTSFPSCKFQDDFVYGIYDDHHTYHEGEQKGVCLLLLFTFAYFRVSLHFFSLLFFFMKVGGSHVLVGL